jgi:hypothetical protein
LRDYVQKADYTLHDPPRLGWLGGPLNQHYIEEIAPALLEVNRRTGARLTMMTSGSLALGPLDAMIDRVPWSMASVRTELAEWDIGINPLRDGLWERGKCAYKLLQYGAAGLAAVGSPVGVGAAILASAELPAPRTHEDWVEALVAMLGASAAIRSGLGHGFRRYVEAEFSYDVWHQRWLTAVLGSTGPRP